jgi:hypothetical protein
LLWTGLRKISIEKNKHTLNHNDLSNLGEKMNEWASVLHGFSPPSIINMPWSGSIRAQQQNVTLNGIVSYVSRQKSPNVKNLESIIIGSLPEKDKRSSSDVMQKVGDKSKNVSVFLIIQRFVALIVNVIIW